VTFGGGELLQMGWRLLAPSTGRFAMRDPSGINDGPNVYAYVRNEPTRRVDPTGLHSMVDPIAGTLRNFQPTFDDGDDEHLVSSRRIYLLSEAPVGEPPPGGGGMGPPAPKPSLAYPQKASSIRANIQYLHAKLLGEYLDQQDPESLYGY
jgi:uncharacterized protein RhaS with RHS repeats